MSRYLDMVKEPLHVKNLTPDQLTILADDIRHELITVLARNGGHLGPNLGVVELTIALHRVFSTPHDKFVWDVSHQVYVHKLLTGRKDRFHTIRTTDGLNGFALRTESPHDCFGAGHAGTALSAALGMCAAREEAEAEQGIRIHSELMVIALNCQHMTPKGPENLYLQYKKFTKQHESVFASYERTLMRFLEANGKGSAEREMHEIRTAFANKISKDAAVMRPDGFCKV